MSEDKHKLYEAGCPAQQFCDYKFNQIFNKLTDIETKLDTRLKKIEEIVVIGNGKPPLRQRVDEIEMEMTSQKEKSKTSWQVWLAIGIALIPVVLDIGKYLLGKV